MGSRGGVTSPVGGRTGGRRQGRDGPRVEEAVGYRVDMARARPSALPHELTFADEHVLRDRYLALLAPHTVTRRLHGDVRPTRMYATPDGFVCCYADGRLGRFALALADVHWIAGPTPGLRPDLATWECSPRPDGRVQVHLAYTHVLGAEHGTLSARLALGLPPHDAPPPGVCPSCGSVRHTLRLAARLPLEATGADERGRRYVCAGEVHIKNVLATLHCAECGVSLPDVQLGSFVGTVGDVSFTRTGHEEIPLAALLGASEGMGAGRPPK